MKRIISSIIAVIMIIATVSGCGKAKDSKPDDKKSNVNTSVKGTVTVGINSYRNSDFETLCEEFNNRFPNVEVKPILFETTRDDAVEYLTSQDMAGKTLPDVLFDDAGSIPTYIQNGWMYPLTSFVKDDEEFQNVPQNIVNHFTYNGNVYALPQTVHSNVVVINEDLVEEMNIDLPDYNWNWDDFAKFIKLCTNTSYSGLDDMSGYYNWIPGCMTEGRTVSGYNEETKTFDLESVRKFVNYYLEIRKLNGVEASSLKQNASSGTSDYVKKFGDISGENAAFVAGKVACAFAGTWDYAKWDRKNLDFNWEFYPVPQCKDGRIPVHVDFCWMTTDIAEENVEAAWEFLKFVTYSSEGNIARLTTYDEDHITADMNYAYYIPVTTDKEVIEKFKSLPYVTEQVLYIFDNLGNGFLNDPEKTVPGIENITWSTIGRLSYESMTERDDFSSKMKDVESKANKEIGEYWATFETALEKFEKEFSATH